MTDNADAASVFEKLYMKTGSYMKTYKGDLVTSFLITAVALSYIVSMRAISETKFLKADWPEHRCKPKYLPFAGWIMPTPGKTPWEATSENFTYCLQQDVSSIMGTLLSPLQFVLCVITTSIDAAITLLGSILDGISELQRLMGGVIAELYEFLLRFIVPLQILLLEIRDIAARINAIALVQLYSVYNTQNVMMSGTANIVHATIFWMEMVLWVVAITLFITATILINTGLAMLGWAPIPALVFLGTGGAIMLGVFAIQFAIYVTLYVLVYTAAAFNYEVFGTPAPKTLQMLPGPSIKKKKKKKNK
jgi:hypothetical protein